MPEIQTPGSFGVEGEFVPFLVVDGGAGLGGRLVDNCCPGGGGGVAEGEGPGGGRRDYSRQDEGDDNR